MAPKRNDIRKTASNLNSKWLQNTLKSMGVAGSVVIKDLMPATVETVSSGSKLATDAAKAIRNTKSGNANVVKALSSTPAVQMGKEFFKNAIEDVKSGNIYNTERTGNSEDLYNDDAFSFDNWDDEATNNDVNVQNNVIQTDSETGAATIKALQQQTEYQLKASKATTDTMVTLASASIMKTNEIGTKVLSELATINTNLAAMIEYNNTNMTKFIEASIGYYEQMSTNKDDGYGKQSDRVSGQNIYSNGGLDLGAYKDYVKGNIKDLTQNSMIGSMASMIIDSKDAFVSNPIGMILKNVMTSAIPKVMQESMKSLDKSIQDFIPTILERVASLEDDTGSFSWMSKGIAKIFGVKTKRETKFDLHNTNKGPMPYNGVANMTLTQIIPKYLRESTSYLKEIAEKITGKSSNEMNGKSRGFDWETGQFTSQSDIQNKVTDQLIDSIASKWETSDFGKRLSSQSDKLRNKSDRDSFDDYLKSVYVALTQKEGQINFNDKEMLGKLLGSAGGSAEQRKLVMAIIENAVANNSEIIGNAHNTKLQATNSINSQIHSFETDPELSGIYQFDDYNIDAAMRERLTGNKNSSVNQGSKKNRLRDASGKIIGYKSQGAYAKEIAASDAELETLSASVKDSSSIREQVGENAAKGMNSFAKILNGIMAGNADEAWDQFMGGIKNVFTKASGWLSENFLNPIKGALFGEKNKEGYLKGGLFEGVNNRMRESFFGLRRMITGKGYTDAEGNKVDNASDDEMKNTVVGKLRGMVSFVQKGISTRLFGEKEEDTEDGKAPKEGILNKFKSGIGRAADSLTQGLLGWNKALFGDSKSDENLTEEQQKEKQKKTLEDIKKKASDTLPSALTGSIVGAGGGMMASGLLGTLVGGPIGGALLGFAGGILSKSEKFQTWLFGKDDENGNHTEGIITKKTQDYFKKNGSFLAGGAALGALKGTFSGAGLLGNLVGGPIGGALLGLGTSVLLKSDMFTKFMFGDDKEGQLGLVNIVKGWFGKFGKSANGSADGGKLAGMMGIGAGVGALTLGAISKAGILGLSLGPAGPIGGALLGLGASILAQKDNFKEWLFGEKDKNGNKVREGILGQFKNMLTANVFTPIGNTVKDITEDFKGFFKYDILQRFNLIIEPIGNAIFGSLSKLTSSATVAVGEFGSYIKDNFLSGLIETAKNVLSPLTTAVTTVTKGVYSMAKAVVSAPLKVLSAITSPIAESIGKAFFSITGAVAKTVNTVLIKPINAIILKPLGLVVKGLGTIIAKPFQLLGDAANFVSTKVVTGIHHIGRFLGRVRMDMITGLKNIITNSGPYKWLQNRFDDVKEAGKHIKKFAGELISPVTNAVKTAVTEIKNHVKVAISKTIKGLFGVITAPFRLIGKGVSALFGIGNKNGNKERKGIFGYIRNAWDSTSANSDPDASNIPASQRSREDRIKLWKANRQQAADKRKLDSEERRLRQKNVQLISKFTGNQKVIDNDDNRALAVEMAKLKGIDISGKFKGDAIKSAEVKAAEQTEQHTASIAENVQKILKFIVNDKTPIRTKEEREKLKDQINKLTGKNNPKNSDVPKHASGINGAKPGPAIVGENGPEAMYDKNSKYGKFVGLSGPEVVNMHGGETVIPNNKISKYADGIMDADYSELSDDNINNSSDSKKLTIGERIIKGLHGVTNAVRIQTNASISGQVPDDSDYDTTNIDKVKNTAKRLLRMIPGAGLVGKAIDAGGTLAGAAGEAATIASGKLSSLFVSNGISNPEEDKAAQASVSDLTGETLHAQRLAEAKQQEDSAREDAQTASLANIEKGQKEHSSVWNSIFSKKGLITGAMLLLIPVVISLLKKLGNSGIGSALGNLLGGSAAEVVDEAKFTYENDALTNGETVGQRIGANVNDVLNGNLLAMNNGEITNQTNARVNLGGALLHTAINSGKSSIFDSGITTTVKGAVNAGKNAISHVGSFLKDSSALSALNDGSETYAQLMKDSPLIQQWTAKGITAAKNVKNAVSVGTTAVSDKLKSATSGNKLLSKVLDYIDTFFKFLSDRFGIGISKLGGCVKGGVQAIKSTVTSFWDDIAAKINKIIGTHTTGAMISAGATELAFATFNAINGLSGTAKLFHVNSASVTGKMKAISTVFGALEGTLPGAIIEVVCELINNCTGVDLLCSLATGIYNMLTDDESKAKLDSAQEAFQLEYIDYQNAAIQEQYESQVASGQIDGSQISLEQFTQEAHAGTRDIKYDSFADYNTKQNATITDKMVQGAANLWNGAKKGVSSAWGAVKSGASAIGNGAANLWQGTKNVASSAWNGVKSGASAIGDSVSSFASSTMQKAGEGLDAFKNILKDASDAMKKGMSQIESNFMNNDVNLSEYAGANVNTLDENNPLHGIVGGALNISKAFIFVKMILGALGKKIKEGLAPIAEGASKINNAAVSNRNTLAGYMMSGDFGGLWTQSTNPPDDTPLSWLVNADGILTKALYSIPTGFVALGKGVKSLFGSMASGAAKISADNEKIHTDLATYIPGGSVGDLWSYEVTPSDDNPIGWLTSAEGFATKAVYSIPTFFIGLGGKIKSCFAPFIAGASKIHSDNEKVSTDLQTYISGGSLSDLWSYEVTPSDDNPIGWLTSVSGFGHKLAYSIPTGVIGMGSAIVKGFTSFMSGASNVIGNISSNNAELAKYMKDGDPIGLIEHTPSAAENNPLGFLLSVTNFMGQLFYLIPTVISGAAQTLISKVKDFGSNVLNNLMNWARGGNDESTEQGGSGTGVKVHGGRGDDPDIVNGSVYYSQNDPRWANNKFIRSDGTDDGATMSDTGCGPTAMSMVLSNMSEKDTTPTQLAKFAQSSGTRDNTGTNWNFVNKAANAYGVSSAMTENPSGSDILNNLKSGNPVMLSGQDNGSGISPYTTAGHYVVAVGTDPNGNVLINDPRGAEYSTSMDPNTLASSTGAAWSFGGMGRGKRGGRGLRKRIAGGRGDEWLAIVQAVKAAIAAQHPGYSQENHITITVGGVSKSVRTDCSGFVAACLQYYGVLSDGQSLNSNSMLSGSPMSSTGFKYMQFPGWDNLQPGDILVKSGHTEIYAGKSGTSYKVYNCGSDSSVNNANATGRSYTAYTTVWRPGSAGSSAVAATINSTDSSGSDSSSNGILDLISTATSSLSSFATNLFRAAITGDFSKSWNDNLDSSTTSSSSSTGLTGNTNAQKVWNWFTSHGYSKAATAGILGNMQQESGVSPTTIQGNGKGPAAGIVQWENYNTKSARWKALSDYAASKGKDWTDLETQLEFIHQELPGLNNYFDGSSSMTAAGATPTTYDQWRQSNDVDMATRQFEGAFERGGKIVMDKRLQYAKTFYDTYSGGSGAGIKNKRYAKYNANGGRGGKDIQKIRAALTPKVGGYGLNNSVNYVSDNSALEALVTQVINVLTAISKNTDNLSLLSDIKTGLTNNNFVSTTTNNISSSNGSTKSSSSNTASSGISMNEQSARRIAFGR